MCRSALSLWVGWIVSSSAVMRPALFLALAAAVVCCLSLQVCAHNGPHVLSQIHVENIVDESLSSARITIHSAELQGEGEMVDVSWDGIEVGNDTSPHWVGLWSPPPTDFTKTAPAKFLKIKVPRASGAHKFWFLNQREAWSETQNQTTTDLKRTMRAITTRETN